MAAGTVRPSAFVHVVQALRSLHLEEDAEDGVRREQAVYGITQPPDLSSSLQFCLGRVEIFGFDLGENSQNVDQIARGAAGCLCCSALQALAKAVSEFQENPFIARIADLRFRPFPDGIFRVENTVFHLPVPDQQGLVLFAEHGLKEGFS